MTSYPRRSLLCCAMVAVALLFAGCDDSDTAYYGDQVWDDVGEEDLELREQLASQNKRPTRAEVRAPRYAQARHPYEVGEMDIEEEFEEPRVRVRRAPLPKPTVQRRPAQRPVHAAPAPAPMPEYWVDGKAEPR